MKILKPVLFFMTTFSLSLTGYAVTCTTGVSWDDRLCGLPDYPGTRCANAEFFRNYCAPGTAGCEEPAIVAMGGCIGFTPSSHWYPILGADGLPKWKCRCGCFASETVFTRETGDTVTGKDVMLVQGKEQNSSFTVSSLDAIDTTTFTDREINSVRYGPEKNPALVFKTKSGRSVMVSASHPMVISDQNGKLSAMKAAEEIKAGEYLIAKDGEADEVTSIEKVQDQGQMVNFNVASDEIAHHIVEANGLLTGDQGWQDQLNNNSSRMLWRNDILKYLAARKVGK
jgi:hypothetical protein